MNSSDRFPRPFPPSFASAWGDDQYGLWADLEVLANDSANVVQKLRWIEPGTFLMGSPEDEAERFDGEGLQHEVTIPRGFWLFDTACTQALWQAVMGDNPSTFKGPDRPVESVSWDDVQTFLAKINGMIPGLNLVLPSEAQWEYACRAGTQTPFSFGETITSEQVNYDGNYPYAGGEKGLYRRETVPVGGLPANSWGLYEMHGNVWEWCTDHWHDNYDSALSDGSARVDPWAGARRFRVLRGGSWNERAQFVRAASRIGTHPDNRSDFFGFRCAIVQEP
jgi:formylglycine-generating enzyme required for sulfatase activity